MFVGETLNIGIWRYYNKCGYLIKEVDENKKFGKIKLDDILRFMEKEGYINLKTGEVLEKTQEQVFPKE